MGHNLISKTHTFSNIRRFCTCLFENDRYPKLLQKSFNVKSGALERCFSNKCFNSRYHVEVGFSSLQKPLNLDLSRSLLGFPLKTLSRLFQSSAPALQKDYYKVLGVKKGESSGDIKKAYYQLAKKYHPDTNKEDGAAERFQEIQEAYEVLSDDKKRSAYDQYGQTDFNGAGGGPGGGNPFGGRDPFGNVNVDDIFKQFFGERAGGFTGFEGGASRSQEYVLNISFMDAVKGNTKSVKVSMETLCLRCNGKKAEPGSSLEECRKCNGTGEMRTSTGFFNMRQTCSKCQGHGVTISDPCRQCRGKGSVIENQKIEVPIPAGIEDGQTVRVPVQYGELFVTFKVAPSKIFSRSGADVASDALISFAQGILGGRIRTAGLDGDIDLTIPPGTQSHQQLRLIGKGIRRLNGKGRGDHYVNIKVHLPKFVTNQQRQLIEEFAKLDTSISGSVNGVVKDDPASGKEDASKVDPSKDTDNLEEEEEGEWSKKKKRAKSWQKF